MSYINYRVRESLVSKALPEGTACEGYHYADTTRIASGKLDNKNFHHPTEESIPDSH